MVYDCIIIGGGPAGLSAAITLRRRNRTALVISNPTARNPLSKAERVDNYLGLPGLTGQELMDKFLDHAQQAGAELRTGKVLSAMPFDGWMLTVGSEVFQAKTLLIATGVARGQKYPGEQRLLGRGVSYCATCDGMLYRNKPVIVVGRSADAPLEANYLADIGCQVTYVSPAPPEGLSPSIPFVRANRLEVLGENAVEGLLADGATLPCAGVFILREAVAPTDLLPDLATEDGYISVNRRMETNLPGVFAAGDCTGKPLQVAKAVGEGQVAAESADRWLEG
ncbi:MAG: FAD-dependent oxidoreductase [Clostridiales bacterium]|nr:FAD-dependent oxidoreductase [Clostridiales bacterium]